MNSQTSLQQLFSDVQLVRNISGGSGAQTWIVQDKNKINYVRKWGHGPLGNKLRAQVFWLRNNFERFHCPQVINEGSSGELYFYDMNYIEPSRTLAQYAGDSVASDFSQRTLAALDNLREISVNSACGRDPASRKKYLDEKFCLNIEKLSDADPDFASLVRAESVTVQGRRLPGFHQLMAGSKVGFAVESLLAEELFNFGHGDLTLSNMLFSEDKVYLIDPNPAFSNISHCQEFSKILQSTHTNYESFERNSTLELSGNSIQYLTNKNSELADLNFRILNTELYKKFDVDLLLLHLAVHLCRILPYVFGKKGAATIYFAEILKILNAIDSDESRTYLEKS